jgi:hypothetical protein
MNAIFDALPGMEVPVGDINASFVRLWADSPAEEVRAMQLNLVLHFGIDTPPADALLQFQHTVQLAQRYPCRVVVLCPTEGAADEVSFRAKIYGECFLGKSGKDTRCCEFVMLSYPTGTHDFLQNQVSTCLSTDLPLYYWAHRFSSNARLAVYDYLLTRARRVVLDSAVVPSDVLSFPWPNPSAVRDLAYTRTRPLRQTIGQFLSRYAPSDIVQALEAVTVRHRHGLEAEAVALTGWLRKGLARCGADPSVVDFQVSGEDCAGCLASTFRYADRRKEFRWTADLAAAHAEFIGNLGHGPTSLAATARLLEPAEALAEAMLF